MPMKLMLVALLASACTQTTTKQCGDFTCGEQSVGSPDGQRCVLESQPGTCSASAMGVIDALWAVTVIDKKRAFIVGSSGTILY